MWELSTSALELMARPLLIYTFLVVGMRLSGKHQVGELSINDLAILLLVSNAVESAMVSDDTSLTAGVIVAGTLFAIEWIVSYLRYRSERFRRVLEGEPAVLVFHGAVRQEALRREQLTEDDLKALLREQGHLHYEEVEVVILETNGTVSVISKKGESSDAPPPDTKKKSAS